MMKRLTILIISCILMFTLPTVVSCTQSGRRRSDKLAVKNSSQDLKTNFGNDGGKTTIKMKKIDGVFEIPIKIDGIQMSFVLDTGASVVSISAVEAGFLYKQGLLSDSDILGNGRFVDANGNISNGTIINLKSVEIGNRVLRNVEASVVNNQEAPLLLGQTALARFGRISIDYQTNSMIIE